MHISAFIEIICLLPYGNKRMLQLLSTAKNIIRRIFPVHKPTRHRCYCRFDRRRWLYCGRLALCRLRRGCRCRTFRQSCIRRLRRIHRLYCLRSVLRAVDSKNTSGIIIKGNACMDICLMFLYGCLTGPHCTSGQKQDCRQCQDGSRPKSVLIHASSAYSTLSTIHVFLFSV